MSPHLYREKKHRKNNFDVCEAVHESEYRYVRRPIDTRTKEPLESAHKFEVVLEPDNFTEEKCEIPPRRLTYAILITCHTDMRSLHTTSKRSITKPLQTSRKVVSSAFFAPAYIAVLTTFMVEKERSAPITSATA